MSDFFSDFWGYYVATATLGGIAFCVALLHAMSKRRAAPSKKPELHGHVWDDDLQEYNNPLPRWWMGLFYITIVFSIGYLALYPGLGGFPGLLAWSAGDAYTAEQKAAQEQFSPIFEKYRSLDARVVAADPEARATGQRLFLTSCAQCHGSDGGGSKGFPSLTDSDWLYGGDPQTIEASIAEGRTGVMPAFGQTLQESEIKDVAYYALSLSGFPIDGIKAYGGRKVFMNTCAACHGADGKGNQAIGAPNLTDRIWLHGNSPDAVMETIAKGRNSHMPSHKDSLDPAKIHLLAAYVYSLSQDPEKLAQQTSALAATSAK